MHLIVFRIPEYSGAEKDRPTFLPEPGQEYNPTCYLQTGIFYPLWIDPRTKQAEFLVNYESVFVSELIAHQVGFQVIYD